MSVFESTFQEKINDAIRYRSELSKFAHITNTGKESFRLTFGDSTFDFYPLKRERDYVSYDYPCVRIVLVESDSINFLISLDRFEINRDAVLPDYVNKIDITEFVKINCELFYLFLNDDINFEDLMNRLLVGVS